MERGADVRLKNAGGRTARDLSWNSGARAVAEWLESVSRSCSHHSGKYMHRTFCMSAFSTDCVFVHCTTRSTKTAVFTNRM